MGPRLFHRASQQEVSLMREVASAPKEFLEALAKDPDVHDWLISVTEIQRTRDFAN